MPKKIELAEIMEKNPQVDPEQLRESMELLEELRSRGVSERGYQLVPPFSGRRVQTLDNSSRVQTPDNGSDDPRTVHLNR
jgi:hypothetical protein